MKNNNEDSTRYYSDAQEKSICALTGAHQTSNSGAGHWRKGDCIQQEASLLIEAKCTMSPKDSFSIKKDWIIKNKEEAKTQRLASGCIAFDFEPGGSNYFVINEALMQFLVDKLKENK